MLTNRSPDHTNWNVMPQIWLLVLGFVIVSLYGYFQFSYLMPCTTAPTCQPEAVGWGMATRVGSARREITNKEISFYQILCDLLDKREKVNKQDTKCVFANQQIFFFFFFFFFLMLALLGALFRSYFFMYQIIITVHTHS